MRLGVCLVGLFISTCAWGADLTGNWLVKQESPDGNVRETYFDLKQDGTTVTGVMRSMSFDRKIESGTIDADGKVVLTMQGQNNRPGQRVQGKFVNGELRVTMGGRGGAPGGLPGPAPKLRPLP